jgi:hypothetical protein
LVFDKRSLNDSSNFSRLCICCVNKNIVVVFQFVFNGKIDVKFLFVAIVCVTPRHSDSSSFDIGTQST